MTSGLTTVAYIGAAILFILSLGGLSQQETARRGNLFGIIGMVIAILATILGTKTGGYAVLIPGVLIGAVIGAFVASKVEMVQMPQLVAMLHSFVGLAAVLVGIVTKMHADATGIEAGVAHELEIVIGVFIGASPSPDRSSPSANCRAPSAASRSCCQDAIGLISPEYSAPCGWAMSSSTPVLPRLGWCHSSS
jgi:hypothetical protein